MLRPSRYNILVGIPGSDESVIVNGVSSAIDILRNDVARLLEPRGAGESLPACALPLPVQAFLAERGYITRDDETAQIAHARVKARALARADAERPPLFYLMLTYACQIRCTYCFEHEVRASLRKQTNVAPEMNDAIIRAAFDAMDALQPDIDKRACTLYGGEPLQPDNRERVERVVAEGGRRGYRFMAASNGVDLQRYRDLLGPNAIAGVHVPIDGPEETHDRLRIGKHRAPTFATIVANLAEALKAGVRVRVRVNANRTVLDRLDELADYFAQAGFLRSPLFSCYVKAIFPSRPGKLSLPDQIGDADVAARLAGSPRLARIFSGYPVIHDRVDALLLDRSDEALRAGHCGAPSGEILIFDPAGRIYPCNNVVGDRAQQIGSFYPSLTWRPGVQAAWAQRTIARQTDLLDCNHAFFCGGGCLYDALIQKGSIVDKSCDCGSFRREFAGLVLASVSRIYQPPAAARHAALS